MSRPWYVRNQQQVVRGPFPARQICQEVLLGRIRADDQVSQDQETWCAVRQVAELIPDVLKGDRSDPDFNRRVEAARRWADERRSEHLDAKHVSAQRKNPETSIRHTSAEVFASQGSRITKHMLPLTGILLVLVAVIYLAFVYAPPSREADIDCTSPAHAGVNWQNCRLDGTIMLRVDLREARMNGISLAGGSLLGSNLQFAELNYSNMSMANLGFTDFSHASLKGANLRAADLQHSQLNFADLSYANLQNAIINDVSFTNARLEHAIWINGKECQPGSIGHCILP